MGAATHHRRRQPGRAQRYAVQEIAPVDGAAHAELAVAQLVFVDHGAGFLRIERTAIMLAQNESGRLTPAAITSES